MAVLRLLAVFAALVGTSLSVTPMEKVITLLEDMTSEVKADGASEATAYEKFACWCKDTTKTKSDSILKGGDTIDTLSATIAQKTSDKVLTESKVQELKVEVETKTKDLADETARYQSLNAKYTKNKADTSKAVSSLESAIAAMNKQKTAIGKVTALVDMRKAIDHSLVLADALSLITPPKRQAMSAFLQEKVDPADATYTYHSDEIIKLLEELKTDFTQQEKDLDDEWKKTDDAYKEAKEALTSSIATKSGEIATEEANIETLSSAIGAAKGNLVEAQSLLKDDQLYMKDMTKQCETSAADWDQQVKMRADEVNALTEALNILKDKVLDADTEVNVRALLQAENATAKVASKAAVVKTAKPHAAAAAAPVDTSKPHSFLQTQRTGTFLEMRRMGAEQRRDRVVEMLQSTSRDIHSPVLAALASQIRADPFQKVKTLIEKLIERLISESTAEATKKGYCDKLIGETEKERGYRLADVKKLNAAAATLEVTRDELTAEIDELTTVSIPNMEKALEDSIKTRSDDKKSNLETIKTAKEGVAALTEAITVLKDFYSKAARATVFLQKVSPIAEDMPAITEGAYKGKQKGSVAVLTLLEQIKDDFVRTIATTTSSEEAAAAEQVKFERKSKSSLEGYKTKKALDEVDLKKTTDDLATTLSEMSDQMKLVDAALKTLEKARPTCIDTGMSYKERKEKREAEITALNKAVCLLDTDGVEEDCKTTL